jgi:hypothetical protein
LYRARCDIHGAPTEAYGVTAPSCPDAADPVRSVAAQVAFYEDVNKRQQERLGEDRFWLVSYEEFCRAPGELVQRVARDVLGDVGLVAGQPPESFKISTSDRVAPEIAAQIDAALSAASVDRLAACG